VRDRRGEQPGNFGPRNEVGGPFSLPSKTPESLFSNPTDAKDIGNRPGSPGDGQRSWADRGNRGQDDSRGPRAERPGDRSLIVIGDRNGQSRGRVGGGATEAGKETTPVISQDAGNTRPATPEVPRTPAVGNGVRNDTQGDANRNRFMQPPANRFNENRPLPSRPQAQQPSAAGPSVTTPAPNTPPSGVTRNWQGDGAGRSQEIRRQGTPSPQQFRNNAGSTSVQSPPPTVYRAPAPNVQPTAPATRFNQSAPAPASPRVNVAPAPAPSRPAQVSPQAPSVRSEPARVERSQPSPGPSQGGGGRSGGGGRWGGGDRQR
jgi:hypothetical protein